MILGDICTRNCSYCGVTSGKPLPPDVHEPERIIKAIEKLDLKYIVLTSVTRDDLTDGGAGHFAAVIRAIRTEKPALKIEVLIPDFKGEDEPLKTVLAAAPFVLNHNVETVPSLYKKVRPEAKYQRSLELLRRAKSLSPNIYTKSGFMVGLGEEKDEVFGVLEDLRSAGCDFVTIGQYLAPSKENPPPARYVSPEEYENYRTFGRNIGLKKVVAGPFVRSSYQAEGLALSNVEGFSNWRNNGPI